jgi:hypothetical protein
MLELGQRKIIPKHQADFRPRKSTLYNIIRLERYAQQLRKRRHAAVILFDIKHI